MSNLESVDITVSLSTVLEQQLREAADVQQKSTQVLIIEAVEQHLKTLVPPKSCHDIALELGVIGVATDLPKDLSTNPEHFEGFGQE